MLVAARRLVAIIVFLTAAWARSDAVVAQCPPFPWSCGEFVTAGGEVNIAGAVVQVGGLAGGCQGVQPWGRNAASMALGRAEAFSITIAYDLSTWDSYNELEGYYDSFSISLSTVPYACTTPETYSDPLEDDPGYFSIAYLWGGEVFTDCLTETDVGTLSTTVLAPNPSLETFLNVALDTFIQPNWDDGYPSWGTFQVVNVTPINFQGGCEEPVIFIDVDEDLESDTDTYLPIGCQRPGLFATVTCPLIDVVAQIPGLLSGGKARFTLFNTTNWRGFAMNLGNFDATMGGPDYALDVVIDPTFDECDEDYSESGPCTIPLVPEGGDSMVAILPLLVRDYAASTHVQVEIIDEFGVVQEYLSLNIPVDADRDGLADEWEAAYGNLTECEDADAMPAGDGNAGDGLPAWEEYRGFFLDHDGVVHVRTSPRAKTLFTTGAMTLRAQRVISQLGIEYQYMSGAVLGGLTEVDTYGGDVCGERNQRAVNVVFAPPPLDCRLLSDGCWSCPTHGVTVLRDPSDPAGECECSFVPPSDLAPNNVFEVRVFVDAIRRSTPPNLATTPVDLADDAAIGKVLAHEVGHALGIDHFDLQFMCPPLRHDCIPRDACPFNPNSNCGPTSVMQEHFRWARWYCACGATSIMDDEVEFAEPGLPGQRRCDDGNAYWNNVPGALRFDDIDKAQMGLVSQGNDIP